MRVIILAAGTGNRLLPITKNCPKCMVRLNGIPILHHQLNTLKRFGIKKILVIGGYLSNLIDLKGNKIIQNKNYKTTNMVYSLFLAKKWMLENEDLLISYGDIIYETKILNNIASSKSLITVNIDLEWLNLWKIRMDNPLEDAETLILGEKREIIEIGKKPKSYQQIQGQYMGLIKLRSDAVDNFIFEWEKLSQMKKYKNKDINKISMTEFLQYLIEKGITLNASLTKGGWLEVDTIQDLKNYENLISNDKLKSIINLEN